MAHFCDRVGARRLLWIALFAWSVLLCVLALTRETWSFAVVLVLVEVAGGAIDTAMNAEASHRLMGSPSALVRLHALFNTGALSRRRRALRWSSTPACPGAGSGPPSPSSRSASACGRSSPTRAGAGPAGPAGPPPPRPATRCGGCARTGSWCSWPSSPSPRSPRAGSTPGVCSTCATTLLPACCSAPGAYVVGQLVAATTRGAGGTCSAACPPGGPSSRAAVWPAPASCSSPSAPLPGRPRSDSRWAPAGASLFWPLVMSTVSRMASQVVSAVGTFTAAGYVGWVAGAPIVGWVSQNLGPGPRAAGPGPGLLRRRRLHPAEPPAQGQRRGSTGNLGRSP